MIAYINTLYLELIRKFSCVHTFPFYEWSMDTVNIIILVFIKRTKGNTIEKIVFGVNQVPYALIC